MVGHGAHDGPRIAKPLMPSQVSSVGTAGTGFGLATVPTPG